MADNKEIYLAGGCFWGVEKYFSLIPGVIETKAGYANGDIENPVYGDVCKGTTGFAETVKITYDRDRISLTQLLDLYFDIIDPSSVNRQGNDVGDQYRTGIYFTDNADETIIKGSLVLLGESLAHPVAIELKPLINFYDAEEYHQKYLYKNPSGYCHIGSESFENIPKRYAEIRKQEPDPTLRSKLSDLQYEVTQNNATETPYANAYYDKFEPGIYVDIVSGEPLFVSTDKFESGCGWPSFSKPIRRELVSELPDFSYGRSRTEVRSSGSKTHLGHVFDDGPKDSGGLRYCINSAALRFIPKDQMVTEGYEVWLDLVEDQS